MVTKWSELPLLSELKTPRMILVFSDVQIHTFSDASQKAYGAAAFVRVKYKDRINIDLVTSKSHVAPLKSYPCPDWNWVREIHALTDPNSWLYCSGKDNPADLLDRGISVDALSTNSKWWNGSSFLRQTDFQTKGLIEPIAERL
ncbi:uncharacterized protein TNCT_54571 [Trichonephila clavata]|uniref:Uncharacterized protein n=1 Tax=Trichonephila clavata TaxID=2740835 RepID=A0A8X6GDR7_TRICU|nr:uncharacterized protein TNCT_54571 [Trichonephila clavata]